ncbi:MAG: hypothetical protein ABS49_09155 [Erythrobacter sp. SCN 62-14]|nr:MAG: hypothetical protein ABS49_09155 [Erythrobacter sp. SCN 62-14]
MTPYARAARHARWMLAVLALTILSVAVAEMFVGHSNLVFAAAIIALIFANARMLTHNCPNCGKNLFFRGALVVFWPNRICGRCGHDCDGPERPNPQNR